MDVVIPGGTDQSFSKSFEKTETNSIIRTTFLDSIGAHEIYSSEPWRHPYRNSGNYLLYIHTHYVIISCFESRVSEPKLLVPFVVFIICFVFVLTIIPLSGAILNPLVTFIAALKGAVTLVRACVYFLGQCVGSIMGYLLIKCVISHDAVVKYMLGGCTINSNGSGVSLGTALMLEFACTFIVLFLGITVAFDKKRCKELGVTMVCVLLSSASLSIAVYVSIVITGEPGYAGAGLNPAWCLGPALIQGGQLWYGHWVFWLGPFLACIVFYGYSKTLPKEGLVNVNGEYDIIKLARACFERNGSPNYLQDKD